MLKELLTGGPSFETLASLAPRQHARQLVWVLETIGISPAHPLDKEVFGGIPLPENVWDSETADGGD